VAGDRRRSTCSWYDSGPGLRAVGENDGVGQRAAIIIGVALVFSPAVPLAVAGPDCTCRANGRDYKQGQVLCIESKLRRCEMYLNNTSWKVISDNCPLTQAISPATAGSLPRSLPPG